jgi:hypothetical protein
LTIIWPIQLAHDLCEDAEDDCRDNYCPDHVGSVRFDPERKEAERNCEKYTRDRYERCIRNIPRRAVAQLQECKRNQRTDERDCSRNIQTEICVKAGKDVRADCLDNCEYEGLKNYVYWLIQWMVCLSIFMTYIKMVIMQWEPTSKNYLLGR